MPKILFIDVEKCVGCRTCEIVCSLSHTREVSPTRSRIKIIQWEAEGHFIPLNCRHCETAPCREICPKQALHHSDEPYRVEIDENKCIGCRACLLVCPFGAITFDMQDRKIAKCDMCQGDPLCVELCAYDALQYVEAEALNTDRQLSTATRLFELQFNPGTCASDDSEPSDNGQTGNSQR